MLYQGQNFLLIMKVMEKYNITKEKLQEYNDLGTITLNSKIIIPNSINE